MNRSGKFSKIITNKRTGEIERSEVTVTALEPELTAEQCLRQFMEMFFSGGIRYFEENYEEWVAEIYEDGRLADRFSKKVYEYPEEKSAGFRWMFEEMEREEEAQIEREIEQGLKEMQQCNN